MLKKIGYLFWGLMFAQSIWASDALEQFKNFSKITKNSSGAFLQQQVIQQSDGQLKIQKELSGQFVFSRPGKFSWTVMKPYEQKIIADGQQLVMWDKDLNQVSYRSGAQALAATPATILFGDTPLEQFFSIKRLGQKGALHWLELTPRSGLATGSDMPYTQIGIGMANNLPQAMELRDNFGNIILLTFSNIKTNSTISSQEFVFKPPIGADVVKLY